MNIIVRQAEQLDSSEIMKILQQHLISLKQNDGELESHGFLIYPHTIKDIQSFISDQKNYCVLVAEVSNRVVGFAICCNIEIMSSLLSYLASLPHMSELLTSKSLYLKQIAKENGTRGVGQALMQSILQHANKEKCNYVVSQIAHLPVKNARSISFHEKFGFELISTVKENAHVTGIYLKKLN